MAELLNNYYLQVLTLMGIHALLGLSVYLALSTGQLTLGNAGFMSIGAYTAALLSTRAGTPFWVGIPAGALLAALIAIPLGYMSLRLRGVYLAIATLGFTESVRVLANALPLTGGPLGVKNIPNLARMLQRSLRTWMAEPPFGLTFIQVANLLVLLGVLALLALVLFFIHRQSAGRVGRAFAAIRHDEVAAEAMGVDTTYYKVLAFTQGAVLAAVAGGLTAHTSFAISPTDFGFSRAVEMLVYVIVGGSGLPAGPVLGAAALLFLSEWLRDVRLGGERLSDYRLIIYGVLLMTMMAVRPRGLLTPGMGRSLAMLWRRLAPRKGVAS